MPKVSGLSPKEAVFVDEYLQTWNGSEAARRAGYSGNDHALAVNAHRLLRRERVRAAIEERAAELSGERAAEIRRHIKENGLIKAKAESTVLYVVREEHGAYKIGVASDLERRLATLSSMIPYELELVMSIRATDSVRIERELHLHFAGKRIRGEWFRLTSDDVEWMKSEYGAVP